MRHNRAIVSACAAAVLLTAGLSGCAGAKQAVKQTVEQGIEPTSAGPHTSAIGNAAQDAVDAQNAQQQEQYPADTGQ